MAPRVRLPLLAAWLAVPLFFVVLFVIFVAIKYSPIVSRNFQQQPPFLPLRVVPGETGEAVRFTTDDGLSLCGSYLPARTPEQAGVIVYCHEYLSDRWSYHPYVDGLRDLGVRPVHVRLPEPWRRAITETRCRPMQWTTDREVHDLRGALKMLRSRPDRDPAGFGLFGVSRGGTTALVAAANEPDVWGVITDGAFPTHGTMVPYIRRWCEVYVSGTPGVARKMLPSWIYPLVARTGRWVTERRLGCKFPSVEGAASKLAPRPWFMIHGGADSYISPEIAQGLFNRGKKYKELWLVGDAKHNRCRETDAAGYAERVVRFLERFAPRRPWVAGSPATGVVSVSPDLAGSFAPADISPEVASPVAG